MKIHPECLIPARPVISFDRIIARLNEDKDGYLPENRDIIKKLFLMLVWVRLLLAEKRKKLV